jgi:hypothetical protein
MRSIYKSLWLNLSYSVIAELLDTHYVQKEMHSRLDIVKKRSYKSVKRQKIKFRSLWHETHGGCDPTSLSCLSCFEPRTSCHTIPRRTTERDRKGDSYLDQPNGHSSAVPAGEMNTNCRVYILQRPKVGRVWRRPLGLAKRNA